MAKAPTQGWGTNHQGSCRQDVPVVHPPHGVGCTLFKRMPPRGFPKRCPQGRSERQGQGQSHDLRGRRCHDCQPFLCRLPLQALGGQGMTVQGGMCLGGISNVSTHGHCQKIGHRTSSYLPPRVPCTPNALLPHLCSYEPVPRQQACSQQAPLVPTSSRSLGEIMLATGSP
jgi:hypothetical protein